MTHLVDYWAEPDPGEVVGWSFAALMPKDVS